MKHSVLIVDDEKNIRRTFQIVLQGEGYAVTTAATGEEGLETWQRDRPDVVVLDVKLPGLDGLEVLRRVTEADAQQPVIMISGHGTIATAVEATRCGAFDFVEKPLSKERLLVAVGNALKVRTLDRRLRELNDRDARRRVMVGESTPIQAIREQIARIAPTAARILITGESGTGKELVARAVHEASDRKDGPFVKVNCAAIPEELIESELFGAMKGAYTGSTESRDGKFLQADGGTLFLDEIGDMSLKAQAKVLRVLQEGEIEKVGGSETLTVDVRVLAATNKDLASEVNEGRFREDLLFRLNVVPVQVPPLRERPDDIPLLAEFFLARYLDENGLPQRTFSAVALEQLRALPWLGNIRELGNAVERLAILSSGAQIEPTDLLRCGVTAKTEHADAADIAAGGVSAAATPAVGTQTEVRAMSPDAVQAHGGLVAVRQAFEKACIAAALAQTEGNVSGASRLLGIDRTNLHKKIQAYGLTPERPQRGGDR